MRYHLCPNDRWREIAGALLRISAEPHDWQLPGNHREPLNGKDGRRADIDATRALRPVSILGGHSTVKAGWRQSVGRRGLPVAHALHARDLVQAGATGGPAFPRPGLDNAPPNAAGAGRVDRKQVKQGFSPRRHEDTKEESLGLRAGAPVHIPRGAHQHLLRVFVPSW